VQEVKKTHLDFTKRIEVRDEKTVNDIAELRKELKELKNTLARYEVRATARTPLRAQESAPVPSFLGSTSLMNKKPKNSGTSPVT